MAFFAVAIAPNFAQVRCRSAWTILVLIIVFFYIGLTQLGSIDSNSWGIAFLALSVLLLLSVAVFFSCGKL